MDSGTQAPGNLLEASARTLGMETRKPMLGVVRLGTVYEAERGAGTRRDDLPKKLNLSGGQEPFENGSGTEANLRILGRSGRINFPELSSAHHLG